MADTAAVPNVTFDNTNTGGSGAAATAVVQLGVTSIGSVVHPVDCMICVPMS